jgi:hypothetical protein
MLRLHPGPTESAAAFQQALFVAQVHIKVQSEAVFFSLEKGDSEET